MLKRLVPVMAAALLATSVMAGAADKILAPTPPMGWNSWDAYGLTITEAEFKANVDVLAKYKAFGWQYAVIDEGWYMADPFAKGLKARQYQLDKTGQLVPALSRYPSAAGGMGLKPIGDYVHAKGLKFGVHVIRGIPKDAVDANLPIGASGFNAREAADTSDTCPWDDGNYGMKDNAAGQAYYDAMMKLFAAWGVDYVKIDCIADHPYKPVEIRMVHDAIQKSGRDIVLSLSPGPTAISHAEEVGKLAQLWRIGDDTWDGWAFEHPDPKSEWPQGVRDGFDKLALWHSYAKPGNWPDADMLPFGSLRPHPGWGDPRLSRLSKDEEKTLFTLWSVARSPLILGGNLTELPASTKALIRDKALIAINQGAFKSHPVEGLAEKNARIWIASTGTAAKPVQYVAAFNLSDAALTVTADWATLGVKGKALHPLSGGKAKPAKAGLSVTLPAHGSAVFKVE